jgi:ligand-binding sensor domain-containing protein
LVLDAPDQVSCFSLSGQRLWSREHAGVAQCFAAGPAVALASVAEPAQLIALDRPTGQVLWRAGLGSAATSMPVVDKNRVFLGTAEGLEIRSLVDGHVLNRTSGELGGVGGPLHVGEGQFAYISLEGQLVVGRTDHGLAYATLSGAVPGSYPLMARQALLFAAPQGLMRVDRSLRATAASVWCEEIGVDQMTSPPVLHGGRVYVATSGRGLVCIQGAGE